MHDWQPIETAPIGKSILMWWRPVGDSNPYAEACVIGTVSAHDDGKWWNGQRGELQDIWHITHWMPLPDKPNRR